MITFTLEGSDSLEMTFFQNFFTLEVCGSLETLILGRFYFGRTDSEQCLPYEGVIVLKGLILDNFYIGRSVVVLKGLVYNNFHFGRMW